VGLAATREESRIKAKARLHISGDRYAAEGSALVEIERRAEGYFFHWKAEDTEDTDIAEDSKTLLFTSIASPEKPHAYLEQYIRTHIQKTQLKRKNRLKVVDWSWIER
jgi:hypothetical protein